MLPRYHIALGFIFASLFKIIFPSTTWLFIVLIFLSSFLIDFDHYMVAVIKNKHLSLRKALDYHKDLEKKEMIDNKKGIKIKGDFHIFHTIELMVFVALLGFVWLGFFYVFIGMLFHSILDVLFQINRGILHKREYIFGNWISKKIHNVLSQNKLT